MNVIVILLIVFLALFAGAFLSKRRFGLLGLGLTAGAIISPIWGDNAGFVLSSTGLINEGPLVSVIALSALILIPSILIMVLHRGYTYKHLPGRIIGSLLFTLLAAAFLVGPIGAAFTLTGPAAGVYNWLVANHSLIISVGVALAVVDLIIAKPAHKSERKHR
jgi:hypothetical protein